MKEQKVDLVRPFTVEEVRTVITVLNRLGTQGMDEFPIFFCSEC